MPETNNNLVSLLINGKHHGGWESVSITRSLENAAAGFQLSVSERFPGQNQPLRILPGDACQVRIGDDLVITGYVDRVEPSHSATSHTVTVSGRSKTCDLVDCSCMPPFGTIKNLTVLQIADRLAKPYKVDIVDALKGDTEPVEGFDVNPGETVFSAISKAAAKTACLLTDDEKGRLLITRAGSAKAKTALRSGQDGNILSARASFDSSGRFREYICSGQIKGNDENYGKPSTENESTVEDRGIKRTRTLYVRSEGLANSKSCQDRARWEASSRIGKAISLTITVQGWRQEHGELWRVNQMVSVKDPLLTVDGDFLVSAVTYTLNNSGTLTTMTISPRSAFELIPSEPEATKGVGIYRDLAAKGQLN